MSMRLEPDDARIPLRRHSRLGLLPDQDRRRPLWVDGDPELLRLPAIGIVGTRRPSAHGLAATRSIATRCAAEGWVVVSGMALGIDVAAHEAALAAGGKTIGVLPSPAPGGLRQGARRLGQQVVEGGLLLSDRPPGTPAAVWSFVARNGLLAALCDGLIVAEAPEGSGALITAEAALEFDLPLAFVTAPYDAQSAAGGAAWLARAGELSLHLTGRRPPQLVTDRAGLQAWLGVCAASVREDSPLKEAPPRPAFAPPPLGGLRALILERLAAAGAAGLTEGDLVAISDGVEGALPAALTLLAAQGWIEQRGGRWRGPEGGVLRSRA
jgi:DNA processing protein